jgi:hypothetical protein
MNRIYRICTVLILSVGAAQSGLGNIEYVEAEVGAGAFGHDCLQSRQVQVPRRGAADQVVMIRPLADFDIDEQADYGADNSAINPCSIYGTRRSNE